MGPIRVARTFVPRRRRRLRRIPLQPGTDVIVVELLAPNHSGEGLPLNDARVFVGLVLLKPCVILISLTHTCSGQIVKVRKCSRLWMSGEPQTNFLRSPSRNLQRVVRGGLSALSPGVHRYIVAMHDVVVEGVLAVPPRPHSIEALLVGL